MPRRGICRTSPTTTPRDVGLAQMTWVVRRTVIDVLRFPTYLEPLDMVTWCSGIGSRWAERRVDIDGAEGGSLSSATLWVHLDPETLRPAAVLRVQQVFATAAAGRSVTSRLSWTVRLRRSMVDWPVRFADFDVMDHVNNAVAFVAGRGGPGQPESFAHRCESRSNIDRRSTEGSGCVAATVDRPTVAMGGWSTTTPLPRRLPNRPPAPVRAERPAPPVIRSPACPCPAPTPARRARPRPAVPAPAPCSPCPPSS